MTPNTKRIALFCFTTALVSVILLSLSLSNLQLQAGMPFPGGGNSTDTGQPISSLGSGHNLSSTLWKGILDLILLLLLISVPLRLIPLINMKRLLRVLLVVSALLLAAYLISRLTGSEPVPPPAEPSGIATQPSAEIPVSPLGQPPQGLIWLVFIGVVLGAGFIAVTLLRHGQTTARVEDQFVQEAASAIHAIELGESLRSVITRCYLQMSQALQEERNIERSENMTVREFEEWLARKGFPSAPVHQLSQLYEKVRYSQQEINEEDESVAVESLNEIVQFCRSQQGQVR